MTDESSTSIKRCDENERDPSEIIEKLSNHSDSVDIADLGTHEPKARPSESLRNSSVMHQDFGKRSTKIVRVSEQSQAPLNGLTDGRPEYMSQITNQGGDIRDSLSNYVKSVRENTINRKEFESAIQYLGITEQELMMRANTPKPLKGLS